MKTFTITFTPNEYLKMIAMFIVMIVLTITGWRVWNWQYWIIAAIFVAVFFLIEKHYPRKK